MANQCDLILMHMKKYGSITAKEAEDEYGCMRLASRINELRREGVEIVSEIITGKSRHGGTTHYARYSLAEVGQ